MGVQLGIKAAAGVLTEHPHHDPLGVNTHHRTVPAHPRGSVILYPAKHRLDCPFVSFDHLCPSMYATVMS